MLLFWVEPRVNPEQLARSLLDEMELTPIDIGITPKGPDAMALVGLPVWLWVDDPSSATWGPKSISAGGVTMTARAHKVVWDLGDGTEVSCGKGTEWTYGVGEKPSPTCGHTYSEQGRYTVEATSYWTARLVGLWPVGLVQLPVGQDAASGCGRVAGDRDERPVGRTKEIGEWP